MWPSTSSPLGAGVGKRFLPVLVLPQPAGPVRITFVRTHFRLFQDWSLAEQISLRSIPGASLFNDPALQGRSGDAIDFPAGYHFENRREGGFWETDRAFVLGFDNIQVRGVKSARSLHV